MNDTIQQIFLTLQELAEVHRLLVASGHEKSSAIAANDVAVVSALVVREKKYVQKISELEQRRIALLGRYFTEQGIVNRRFYRMDQLIAAVYQAEEKLALQKIARELSTVVKELRRVNEFNQQLVRQTLDYLHFSQDIIAGPAEEEVTYHRELQRMAYNRNSRFDKRT